MYAITLSAIRDAASRIAGKAHVTPVVTSQTFNRLSGLELFFKCENLQKVGAFKFRGACNAVQKLDAQRAPRGVLTHSSGNHAQALALAAKMRGIPAHIVMPTSAPAVKRRAVEGYGGQVIECEPDPASREAVGKQVEEQTGATFIHPSNHPDVMAGQGTAALELLEQVSDLDAILAPIGGGGLISGLCVAAHGLLPRLRVFAAEPLAANDAFESKRKGAIQPSNNPKSIADGLLTSLGDNTWPIVRDQVEQILVIPESAIAEAMRLFWERCKMIIEPSAAVAVAAVFSDELQKISDLKRVGVILSGGNVDLARLPF